MSPLELKKRALAAESEVYREMLKLELHNLRLYAVRAKKKFSGITRPNPLLMLAAPLAGSLLRKRRGKLIRKAGLAFLSWQLTNRLKPFLAGFLSPRPSNLQTSRNEPVNEVR